MGRHGWRPEAHSTLKILYPESKNSINTIMKFKDTRPYSLVSKLPYEMLFEIFTLTASGYIT